MPQKILPVYFYPGPEVGRKRERLEALTKALEKQDGEPPEVHRFYPYDSETPEITSILKNGALFSSRRLVILSDAHVLKAADIKIFKEYFTAPSPEATLVFTSDEGPGSRNYPRSLADALPKNAVEVFWEMFERDKRGWVLKFFREKGLRADNSAIDLLLDVTEGTTDALREACDLLAFSVEPGQLIGEKEIDRVLEHGRDETVYSLFDRFCRRDLNGVLESYRKMLHSDPGLVDRILSMLAEPLTRLGEYSVLIDRGLPSADAAKELKLRGGKRAVKAYNDGAHRFSMNELGLALRQLINLESWLRNAPRELRAAKTELWFCHVLGRSNRS